MSVYIVNRIEYATENIIFMHIYNVSVQWAFLYNPSWEHLQTCMSYYTLQVNGYSGGLKAWTISPFIRLPYTTAARSVPY